MRSLFLKIFLWFWLSTAVALLVFLISVVITQSKPAVTNWRIAMGDAITIYAQMAVNAFEQGGKPSLKDYLERMEKSLSIHAVLFDHNGEELSGNVPPEGAAKLANVAAQTGEAAFDFSIKNRTTLIAQRVMAANGKYYVLVSLIPRGPGGLLAVSPSTWIFRLALVIISVGLVCYWLARYLTNPIIKLQKATRQLSAGDLTARTGLLSSKRRDELTDLGRDFDLMSERIESLITTQNRLIRDISHELRSPLTRLNIALALLRDQTGENAKAALDRCEREADRLNDMITQLLTLARLENSPEEVGKNLIDINAIISDITNDADFEARNRNCSVRFSSQSKCVIKGSQDLIRSAIENVVRNALRYTADGTEVNIELKEERTGNGLTAVIRVEDQGQGVPEEELSSIVQPFYRVAESRERKTGGAGLGLAITDRIVRLHEGNLSAMNAHQGGLIVEIRLPCNMDDQQ
jgi:two-component system, OmpR family, sensor histidine kinase CpxA